MSLLKTNEIQNYNGSSLTLTASTVSTSAQLNTGGNISVTGSLNVSDDSTTRTNLGLGTIATQDSDSITVTGGTATLGALTVSGSDSGDLVRITQTGSGNALVVEDSANPDSTPFVVDASGNVGIGTSSPSKTLEVNGTGWIGVSSTAPTDANFQVHSTVAAGNVAFGDETSVVVSTNTEGAGNQGFIGSLWFGSQDIGASDQYGWKLAGMAGYMAGDTTASGGSADLVFYTANSSQTGTERMRIDSSGRLLVTPSVTVSGYGIRTTGERYYNRYALELEDTDQFTQYAGLLVKFKRNGTDVGTIQTTGSSTAYNTSSDYRLKENITEITDGITRVKQLNPSRFNFIVDPDKTVDGFIAHEVQDIVPEAISGEKDAVNEDGSINPQGIDQAKLVPLLTSALQESIALIESQQSQIDALTARIEALETT